MGTFSPTDINRVIKGTTFTTDHKKYSFVKLDRKDYQKLLGLIKPLTSQFVEIIYDKDELTLIVEEETWKNLSSKITAIKIDDPIARITCEVQEAFTTDHIFVYHKDLERALKILNDIKTLGITLQ